MNGLANFLQMPATKMFKQIVNLFKRSLGSFAYTFMVRPGFSLRIALESHVLPERWSTSLSCYTSHETATLVVAFDQLSSFLKYPQRPVSVVIKMGNVSLALVWGVLS